MVRLFDVNRAFGEILKERRQNQRYTQQTFADQSGLSRSYLSNLEVGIQDPSINTIFTLAKTLKMKPSALVYLMEEKL